MSRDPDGNSRSNYYPDPVDYTIETLEKAVRLKGEALRQCQDGVAQRNARIQELETALREIATVDGEYLEDWDATVEVSVDFLRSVARRALKGGQGGS